MTRLSALFVLALSLVLAACANTTVEQAATSEVVVSPASATASDPTGVDLGTLQRYSHASGLFSLDVPAGWQIAENSTANELVVRFADANQNAAIITNVMTITGSIDQAGLDRLLSTYLHNTYGSQREFAQQPIQAHVNGRSATWGYDATNNGATTRLAGSSLIEQRAQRVSVISVVVPDAQFARLQPAISTVLASYSMDASAPGSHTADVSGLAAVELTPLQSYTHPGQGFTIGVPAGWAMQDTSESGSTRITWSDPTNNAWLMVHLLSEDSQRTPDELAALLRDIVSAAFGERPGFVLGEASPRPEGGTQLTWVVNGTADNGVEAQLTAASVIEQHGERIAIVTFALPAHQAEVAQPSVGAIFNSFSLD